MWIIELPIGITGRILCVALIFVVCLHGCFVEKFVGLFGCHFRCRCSCVIVFFRLAAICDRSALSTFVSPFVADSGVVCFDVLVGIYFSCFCVIAFLFVLGFRIACKTFNFAMVVDFRFCVVHFFGA